MRYKHKIFAELEKRHLKITMLYKVMLLKASCSKVNVNKNNDSNIVLSDRIIIELFWDFITNKDRKIKFHMRPANSL